MKKDISKNIIAFLCIILFYIVIFVVYFIVSNNSVKIIKYSNDYYSFKYDNTWKMDKEGKEVVLIHKRSNSKAIISYKELDTYLIDVDLKEMISDLIYVIDNQNKDYKLINKQYIEDSDMYKLLYEKDNEECLVNIIKKDNNIVFVYFNSLNEYFDITYDSFEEILSSIKIRVGESINEKN